MSGLVYHIALLNGVWSSGDLLIWPAAIRQGAFQAFLFLLSKVEVHKSLVYSTSLASEPT